MISQTEYDKRRHLQVQIDKLNDEIKFLKRELLLCQEQTITKSKK
jgi:hypothetical protein